MIPPGWAAAFEAALDSPLILVIGAGDTGKTTLVTALATHLHERGHAVGVVDADLGQSALGPPTTVGLGRVSRPLERLGDAELLALAFAGATSPAANLTGALVGTARMVARARAEGLTRVVVDTSGLIAGDLGRTLKQAKIELLDADLVIALERAGECAAILHPYRGPRPRIARLAPAPVARSRSADERRRYREQALAAYFAGARLVTLDLRRVVLKRPALFAGDPVPAGRLEEATEAVGCPLLWAERLNDGETAVLSAMRLTALQTRELSRTLGGPVTAYALEELTGALAGLDGAAGETLGLGIVRGFETAPPALRLLTPVTSPVSVVTIGRARYEGPDAGAAYAAPA